MYILECADSSYYTSSTRNIEKRVWFHQQGLGANYTRQHLPVELVYYEEYEKIEGACYRERQIKGWSRAKKKALIDGRKEDLRWLSKKGTIK